jgi:hypothetical protein
VLPLITGQRSPRIRIPSGGEVSSRVFCFISWTLMLHAGQNGGADGWVDATPLRAGLRSAVDFASGVDGGADRHHRLDGQTDYRPSAFVARSISPAVALVVQGAAPHYSTALCSMVIGGIAYWAVSAVTRPAAQTA